MFHSLGFVDALERWHLVGAVFGPISKQEQHEMTGSSIRLRRRVEDEQIVLPSVAALSSFANFPEWYSFVLFLN